MDNRIIDMHIHFGSPDDKASGCFWSKKFESTLAYYAMLLVTKSLFKKVTLKTVRKQLLGTINGSKYVDKSVLLAMDMVYDANGNTQKEWTHLYVPNKYLAKLATENERVLFGASVHPYRKDWRQELDFCMENKAVLCKWIPSSQQIDPTNQICIPFYKKLAEYKLPLLCHAGPEHAVPTTNEAFNEYNNPKYLHTALDLGVSVIVAHCAMPYFGPFDQAYLDDFDDFLKMMDKAEGNNWDLYADVSAICTPTRIKYISDVKKHLDKFSSKKLIFGSDYPIPISELSYNKSKNFVIWLWFILKVIFMKNPLDKNYKLIKKMDFDEAIFENAGKLFANIKY